MQTSQKINSEFSKPFLDYIPAELKVNKDWIITYYVLDPTQRKLVRKRKRVPHHNKITERRKIAKRMIANINNRLLRGWNPIIEDEAPKSLRSIIEAANEYLNSLERDFTTGSIRKDTYRTYTSFIVNFINWLKATKNDNEYVLNFNASLISSFLEYIYIERKNTARTYNNYLMALRQFSKYLIQKGYKKNDATNIFSTKRNTPKKRGLIERNEIENIFRELDQNFLELSIVCKLIYYCYIRPTELSRLQIKDVLIKDRLIYLSPEKSKKSSGYLTVPTELMQQLATHISKAKTNDFIFSLDECKPGTQQANGKLYYDRWQKFIVKKGFTNNPLYSLKDSGITFALDNGVSPVSVMNQARHSDLSITTAYLRKPQKTADQNILNAIW